MEHPLVILGLAVALTALLILAASLGLVATGEEPSAVPAWVTGGLDSRRSVEPHQTGGDGTRWGYPTKSARCGRPRHAVKDGPPCAPIGRGG